MKIGSTLIGAVAVLVLAACGTATRSSSGGLPEVVGLSRSQAINVLSRAGYADVRMVLGASKVAPPGTIIVESPAAGSRVAQGSEVVITMVVGHRGPPVVNPEQTPVSSAVIRHVRGFPSAAMLHACGELTGRVIHPRPCAAWAGPHSLYITTWGDRTCPNIPTSVRLKDSNTVVVETVRHTFFSASAPSTGGNGFVAMLDCDAVLTATTSLVWLPARIDSSHRLVVKIDAKVAKVVAVT